MSTAEVEYLALSDTPLTCRTQYTIKSRLVTSLCLPHRSQIVNAQLTRHNEMKLSGIDKSRARLVMRLNIHSLLAKELSTFPLHFHFILS